MTLSSENYQQIVITLVKAVLLLFFFHTVHNLLFPAALYNYIATARP